VVNSEVTNILTMVMVKFHMFRIPQDLFTRKDRQAPRPSNTTGRWLAALPIGARSQLTTLLSMVEGDVQINHFM